MNSRRGSGRRCLSSVMLIPTLSAALTTLAILLLSARANAAPSLSPSILLISTSLGQNEIVLMGHSWGAALGALYVQAHPEKISAFIAINPLVSMRESQQAQYDFVLAEATRRHDVKASTRLRKIGTPPYQKASQALAMEKVAQRYGAIFHTEPHRSWVMLRAIFSGLVTPWEIPRLIHANNVSLDAMNEELLGLDLTRSVPSLDVPILFFLGRYDRHIDAKIAAAYFETLHAPVKRLLWFEKSAHNIPFEESELFNATVLRELQSIGIGTGHREMSASP